MKKIILIGFATSGKSSVGRLLAERLNANFVDTDDEIERQCGMTIEQIFCTQGENFFRQKENELLSSLVDTPNLVVACGGGSVLAASFPSFAAHCKVIWLTVTASTVKRRLGNVPRPLFDGLDESGLAALIEARAPLYQQNADVTVATDDLTVAQVVTEIFSRSN